MSKSQIEQLIKAALQKLQENNQLIETETPSIQIDVTKDKQHGDFASNIALVLAKKAKRPPRELADLIVEALPISALIAKVVVAGPGFINFYLTPQALFHIINEILMEGETFGQSNKGQNRKVLIEFVSSNPTGPLHVGHGRHAAYGAVVADLLTTIGFKVSREYYVNDAGRQMDILALSVWLRYLSLYADDIIFPANGYKGDYVIHIAEKLKAQQGEILRIGTDKVFENLPPDEPQGGDKEVYIDSLIVRAKECLGEENYASIFNLSLQNILEDIRDDLSEFGVHFDRWFSERELTQTDAVDRLIATLTEAGQVYELDGALWFRSTEFKDEKDRVLQRKNGQRTYFANDLAYHMTKFERQFDKAIDVFGSDHHGYIPRMQAGLEAFGIARDRLTYLLMQFVSLYRNGQQLQMSTRSGSFITLRELRKEVGNDAARYFYIMRRCEQPIDFDLDLAKSKTNENPVYYIQYAHARICSVFKQLEEKNKQLDQNAGLNNLSLLSSTHELQLLSTLSRYRDVIMNAAELHEPHILTNYLRELANDFHGYYNAQQFIVEDSAMRNSRLVLINAVRQVLVNGLKLIGVSQPQSM